jgi:hypothetical protein
LGILLLSSGLGIIIYKNIDSIGHTAIVIAMSVLIVLCFAYSYWKRQPFSWNMVVNPAPFADFSLLLACLLFLTLEGYLQYQYDFFGTKYGMATLLPAMLFIGSGYFFDHRGVLSMGITAFASWVGVSIAPFSVFLKNDFTANRFTFTAIGLGIGLAVFGLMTAQKNLKKHFEFTYLLLGSNLALFAATAGIFVSTLSYWYVLIVIVIATFLVLYARRSQSYLFLLMGVIFAYIAITYVLFQQLSGDWSIWLVSYYFIFSGIGVVLLLVNIKKILAIKNK